MSLKLNNYLPFKPLPWQEKALDKFYKLDNDIKYLQKLGGAGKTYLCVYYALKKYGLNAKIGVIASPNQHLSWKKTFKDLPVDYISTGIINKKTYVNNEKYDIILFDEVDSHAKKLTSNTMKNFKKLNKKESILLSATLIAGNYVNSMNYLKLQGWKEGELRPYFNYSRNYNISQQMKQRLRVEFIEVNEGINEDMRETYENIFNSYGYIEFGDIKLTETEITNISTKKREDDFIFNFNKIELESERILKIQDDIIKYSFINETQYLLGKSYEKYNTLLQLSSGIVPTNDGRRLLVDTQKIKETIRLIMKYNLDQVFIFYNNHSERDLLMKYLKKHTRRPVYLNGDVQKIQKHQKRFILLGHYKSIGRGLDFETLQAIILFAPTEQYEEFKQALYRLGRESSIYKNMYIWELYYKDTLHEMIFEKQNKFENFNKNKFIKDLK